MAGAPWERGGGGLKDFFCFTNILPEKIRFLHKFCPNFIKSDFFLGGRGACPLAPVPMIHIQNWNASGHHDTNVMILSDNLKVIWNIMLPRKSWTVDMSPYIYCITTALLRAGCRSSYICQLNEDKELNILLPYIHMLEEGWHFFIFFWWGIHDQRKVWDCRKSYFTVIVCFVFSIESLYVRTNNWK